MIKHKRYFVGIGAAKAGTTWLHRYLLQHPQVCISPIKELHYYDDKFIPEMSVGVVKGFSRELAELAGSIKTGKEKGAVRRIGHLARRLEMNLNDDAYAAYFKRLLKKHHRVFGEITPAYSMLGEAGFRGILEAFPDAQFVLILRNPADRFWSQLRFTQKIQKGFSPLEQFDDMLTDPKVLRRGDYHDTLTSLDAAGVPDEQLFVTFYEHLFGANGADELTRLCDFLNVKHREGDLTEVRNESPELELAEADRSRVVAAHRASYQTVASRHPPLPSSWQADLDLLATLPGRAALASTNDVEAQNAG